MSKKGPAGPDDVARRWVREKVMKARDAAILAGGNPDGEVIADAVAKTIRSAEAAPDLGEAEKAKRIIDIGLRYYIVQKAGDICRSAKLLGAIGWNGLATTHAVPARPSFPKRDQSGARLQSAGQFKLWIDVSRAEYLEKLAEIQRAYDHDGKTLALWRKGEALLLKHPSATSLSDACRLDGVDVQQFLLG